MLFNSKEFLLAFLPLCLAGHFLCRPFGHRAVLGWLLVASLGFYAWWDWTALPLLLGSIAVNYALGRRIAETKGAALLAVAIIANLALLGFFKYGTFVARGLPADASQSAAAWLPLGLSFFTFHQIAYLVDCRRNLTKRHDWLHYAVFVSFFPQLIAGPIVSQRTMLPQLTAYAGRLSARAMTVGLAVLTIGLVKKVVVADGIAEWSDAVFAAAKTGRPIQLLEAWGGALSYTFQIYFDFSGYSDMAIGLGLMLGLRLPLNFHSPYRATSIIEFWRRWHMTLSWFLREYLYIPLGGSRAGPVRRYGNLAVVMLLGGLWHGAGWTFLAWGGLHGTYLIANHAWRAVRGGAAPGRLGRGLGWALSFVAVVVAWVFFRADTFAAAANILSGMAGAEGRLLLPESYRGLLGPVAGMLEGVGASFVRFDGQFHFWGVRQVVVLAVLLAAVLMLPNTRALMRVAAGADIAEPLQAAPRGTRPVYALITGFALAALTIWFIVPRDQAIFLYFQF